MHRGNVSVILRALGIVKEKGLEKTHQYNVTSSRILSSGGSSSVHSRNFSPILTSISCYNLHTNTVYHEPTEHSQRARTERQSNGSCSCTMLERIRESSIIELRSTRHDFLLQLIHGQLILIRWRRHSEHIDMHSLAFIARANQES
jgi:hypothetical protein